MNRGQLIWIVLYRYRYIIRLCVYAGIWVFKGIWAYSIRHHNRHATEKIPAGHNNNNIISCRHRTPTHASYEFHSDEIHLTPRKIYTDDDVLN